MSNNTMELRTRMVGIFATNTYVLVCPTTHHSVLIDPGADPATLHTLLEETTPVGILITHTHSDHINALASMQQRLQVPVMAHRGPHQPGVKLQADRWLDQDDTITVGDHTLKVYHTPGHTPDLLCFGIEHDPRIIVGDTLFVGGPGRTRSLGGFRIMCSTLRTVVLSWSDDTLCYPGHGPAFRLGDIRPLIEQFLAQDHGDFFGDATWEM